MGLPSNGVGFDDGGGGGGGGARTCASFCPSR